MNYIKKKQESLKLLFLFTILLSTETQTVQRKFSDLSKKGVKNEVNPTGHENLYVEPGINFLEICTRREECDLARKGLLQTFSFGFREGFMGGLMFGSRDYMKKSVCSGCKKRIPPKNVKSSVMYQCKYELSAIQHDDGEEVKQKGKAEGTDAKVFYSLLDGDNEALYATIEVFAEEL